MAQNTPVPDNNRPKLCTPPYLSAVCAFVVVVVVIVTAAATAALAFAFAFTITTANVAARTQLSVDPFGSDLEIAI